MARPKSPPPYTPPTDPLVATEADPLISRPPANSALKGRRVKRPIALLLVIIITLGLSFALYASIFPVTKCHDPLDPGERNRVREEWRQEKLAQEELRGRWKREEEERARRREAKQRSWEREMEDRKRKEETDQEKRRLDWQHEVEDHERKRREDEQKRKRAHLTWSHLEGGDRCLSYNTKEYTAQLSNVPPGLDRLEACMATPIVIHGATLHKPDWCEVGSDIIGHWVVKSNEPTCSTYWGYFQDKGCITEGSHTRRFDGPLENLRGGDDWREMCATTPADFHGMHFDRPTYCTDWGKHGIWGIWEVPDSSC